MYIRHLSLSNCPQYAYGFNLCLDVLYQRINLYIMNTYRDYILNTCLNNVFVKRFY